ncbi:response regulator transcription factor [Wenyingzhuangia sp. IMCC45467]
MKILIAEDDALILSTLEFRLKKDGYHIITAVDGREALQKIEEHTPDLIISDIMMPYVSGLEIIGAVKEKYNSSIAIIILTTMGQEEVVLEAFELGADDFISKPFSPNELSVRVKRFALRKNK